MPAITTNDLKNGITLELDNGARVTTKEVSQLAELPYEMRGSSTP